MIRVAEKRLQNVFVTRASRPCWRREDLNYFVSDLFDSARTRHGRDAHVTLEVLKPLLTSL